MWTFVVSDGPVILIKIIPHRNYRVEKIILGPEPALKNESTSELMEFVYGGKNIEC